MMPCSRAWPLTERRKLKSALHAFEQNATQHLFHMRNTAHDGGLVDAECACRTQR
jgi:hypothetical protein